MVIGYRNPAALHAAQKFLLIYVKIKARVCVTSVCIFPLPFGERVDVSVANAG